jgi:hypothetical protein
LSGSVQEKRIFEPHFTHRGSLSRALAWFSAILSTGLSRGHDDVRSEKATAKRFGVRARVPKDKPKEVATLWAFERPHLVPSGNRGDPYDDPFDIASDALELGIHGGIPLVGAPTFKASL